MMYSIMVKSITNPKRRRGGGHKMEFIRSVNVFFSVAEVHIDISALDIFKVVTARVRGESKLQEINVL